MTESKITIIGGGISGLIAAQGLKKHGIPFELYSKESKDKDYNLDIRQPAFNSMTKALPSDILDKLVNSEAQKRTTFYQLDSSLNVLMVIKKDTDSEDKLYCFERIRMLNILKEGVEIKESSDIKGIRTEHGKSILELEDGNQVQCDVLVVADGSHSQTRKIIFKEEICEKGYRLLIGKTKITKLESNDFVEKLTTGPLLIYGNAIGIFMSKYKFQSGEEFISWYLSCKLDTIKDLKSQEELSKYIKKATEETDPKIQKIIKDFYATIKVKKVAYIDPELKDKLLALENKKILCLGDSIHPMAPFKGVGGSKEIEDVGDVVECIKRYIDSGCKNDAILGNFTIGMADRGFGRVKETIKACDSLHVEGWLAQTARNTILKGISTDKCRI